MRYQRELAIAQARLASARRAVETTRSPIERRNLSSHLPHLEEDVRRAQLQVDSLAEVDVLFDGDPVQSSVGIEAAFAGDSLRSFQDYVSTITAANQGSVGSRGPLPDVPRLMVADVGVGSFGFQLLELPQQGSLVPTPLKGALHDALRLLQAATESDDSFVDALATRGQRVQAALKRFLEILDQGKATLKLESGQTAVHLDSLDAVRAARTRVSNTQTTETELDQSGLLFGWMQGAATFELRLDSGEILSGPIAPSDLIPRGVPYLNQRVLAHLRRVTVEPVGRTRWVLLDLQPS